MTTEKRARVENFANPETGSQGGILRERMKAAGLRHDSRARVSIPNVLVHSSGILYFCSVPKVHVHEVLDPGDGQTVSAHELRLLGQRRMLNPGAYVTFHNVLLHNNGTLDLDLSEMVPEYHDATG